MVTAPWGCSAVATVLKQGSKWNVVKTPIFPWGCVDWRSLKSWKGYRGSWFRATLAALYALFWVKAASGSPFNTWSWKKVPPGFSTKILYIYICHHAFWSVILKWRMVLECVGNICLYVVPNAITLLCAGFPHLMSFSEFVSEDICSVALSVCVCTSASEDICSVTSSTCASARRDSVTSLG